MTNGTRTTFRKVAIRPFAALGEAKELLAGHYWLLLGITVVGMLIGSWVPMALLIGPMMCGIYLCHLRRMRGEAIRFEMLFEGFEYFVDSLVVSLTVTAVILVLILPISLITFFGIGLALGLSHTGRGGAGIGLTVALVLAALFLAVLVVALLLGTCAMFAYRLIVHRRLKALGALETSLRAVWANLAGMLGLTLVIAGITLAAVLCCYVPALFVIPLTFAAQVVAYRRVFPPT